jgi:hypothetical protein
MYAMSKKPATVNSVAKAHAEYSDGEDEDIDYGDEQISLESGEGQGYLDSEEEPLE